MVLVDFTFALRTNPEKLVGLLKVLLSSVCVVLNVTERAKSSVTWLPRCESERAELCYFGFVCKWMTVAWKPQVVGGVDEELCSLSFVLTETGQGSEPR